jgi:hypothetical protein
MECHFSSTLIVPRGCHIFSATHKSVRCVTFNSIITNFTRKRVTKNWGTEHSKGNKTVPSNVATTCTEDGQKQITKTSTALHTKRTNEHRTTEEEMGGPTAPVGLTFWHRNLTFKF